MDIGDNTEFRNRLVTLAELFDLRLAPTRQALYFEALRDLPFDAVAHGLNQAARACTFFPKPAELRALAVGDEEDAAETAWMALRLAMRSAGSYASLVTADAALGEAIVAVFGGWPQVCALDLSAEMWANKRKEFGRVYRVLRSRGLSGSRYLAGICEQQNAGRPEWMKFVQVQRIAGAVLEALSLDAAERERTQLAAASHGFTRLGAGVDALPAREGETA